MPTEITINKNFNLKKYNSFGFESVASNVVFIHETDQLIPILKFFKPNNLPLIILGGGNNVILKDNIDGLVIIIKSSNIKIIKKTKEHTFISVDSGFVWDDLVQYTLSRKMYGLENLSMIPGTVGASPIQNIGAYGAEVKDVIYEIDALDLNSLKFVKLKNSDCKFNYRDSLFKNELRNHSIITSVTFRLNNFPTINLSDKNLLKVITENKTQEITPELIRDYIVQIRSERLPDVSRIGNTGSFYINPIITQEKFSEIYLKYPDILFYPLHNNLIKLSAGWLIDKCGYRGFKNKNVGVYQKNPLVLVNYGEGKPMDILDLSNRIVMDVYQKFNIKLVMEPSIYG